MGGASVSGGGGVGGQVVGARVVGGDSVQTHGGGVVQVRGTVIAGGGQAVVGAGVQAGNVGHVLGGGLAVWSTVVLSEKVALVIPQLATTHSKCKAPCSKVTYSITLQQPVNVYTSLRSHWWQQVRTVTGHFHFQYRQNL